MTIIRDSTNLIISKYRRFQIRYTSKGYKMKDYGIKFKLDIPLRYVNRRIKEYTDLLRISQIWLKNQHKLLPFKLIKCIMETHCIGCNR